MAENKEVQVVEMKSGNKYFFGDSVNAYLLENKYSVLNLMNGAYENMVNKKAPDAIPIIAKSAQVLDKGDYKIFYTLSAKDLYQDVISCWNGIFDNMTNRYCHKPSEWPIFFGIVLFPPDEIYVRTLECVLYISKMRDESIKN